MRQTPARKSWNRRKKITNKRQKNELWYHSRRTGFAACTGGVGLPKPLVRMCGRPMIGRLIDIFVKCGAESVSVIVNEEMTEVAEYLRSLAPSLPCPLNLVVKTTPTSMHSFYELSSLMEGRDGL